VLRSLLNRLLGATSSSTSTRSRIDETNAQWVLGRVAALGRSEWQSLVRAHADAGRSGPIPLKDVQDRAERIGYPILEATQEAGRLALNAAGPEAAEAWRKSLVLIAKGTPGEGWQERDQRLYEIAWAHMSAAEWAAAYVVARRTLPEVDWFAFWSVYRPIFGTPPSDITPASVLGALKALDAEEWSRLASSEGASQRPDGTSRTDAVLGRATVAMQSSNMSAQVGVATEEARIEAREIALVAAGPEATAAHRRVAAIARGSGVGLLVDPSDAQLAEPAWLYMDAASNAVLVACARTYLSAADFLAAWEPYEATIGRRIGGSTASQT
jgi:hypothetical protein